MTTHVKLSNFESSSALDRSSAAGTKLLTRIGRTYRFESAHHLPNLPDGHKCKNLHGHNYRIEVILSGALDSRGFVKDFADIDVESWFLQRITGCESVRVYENDECWAEVRPLIEARTTTCCHCG
jgi:6-pyruvoyltetrahydropterin/6-carboxytetrahydropterin synthase